MLPRFSHLRGIVFMQASGAIVVVMSNLGAAAMVLGVIATACLHAKPTCSRCLCQTGYVVRRLPQAFVMTVMIGYLKRFPPLKVLSRRAIYLNCQLNCQIA
jgi:hypothetical protein